MNCLLLIYPLYLIQEFFLPEINDKMFILFCCINHKLFNFSQKIDHFANVESYSSDSNIFNQRYYWDETDQAKKAQYTIFLYVGRPNDIKYCNPYPVFEMFNSTSSIFYMLEHRYFGKSLPNENNGSDFSYLTVEQVLYDINNFIKHIVSVNESYSKIILFGNGFSGSLSIYYSLKFPNDKLISWASSPPLYFNKSIKDYGKNLILNFNDNRLSNVDISKDCLSKIQKILDDDDENISKREFLSLALESGRDDLIGPFCSDGNISEIENQYRDYFSDAIYHYKCNYIGGLRFANRKLDEKSDVKFFNSPCNVNQTTLDALNIRYGGYTLRGKNILLSFSKHDPYLVLAPKDLDITANQHKLTKTGINQSIHSETSSESISFVRYYALTLVMKYKPNYMTIKRSLLLLVSTATAITLYHLVISFVNFNSNNEFLGFSSI